MIRIKQCCCGCTLDVGARIILWTDLIATSLIALNLVANSTSEEYDANGYLWALSAIIIPAKLIILIGAVIGVNKKKAAYLHPYVIFNVLAIATKGLLVLGAIYYFDAIVDSDVMKYLMRGWTAASLKHPAERTKHDFDIITDQYPDQVELSTVEANHAVRVSFLSFAIISGIVSFFVWSYFTIVLHSYYKTLLLGGAGNFVNINGVEYFAPTERIAGKSVPQDVPPQLNVPPSYYTASAYPIQPTISYPQAPPSYDEAAGPNASMYPSFPPTRQ